MIKITSNISETTVRLGKWISRIGGGDRKILFSAAANAVAILVRSHLSKLGRWKHFTAERLSAHPTGFLKQAARKTNFIADENAGEVVIAAPLGRAFHDVEIRPKNKAFLTIPAAAESYGDRAPRMEADGWKIWRPKNKKYLMGSKEGVDPKILFWIKESVHQRQDRSLLPSDEEMQRTATKAVMATIKMRVAS